MTPDQAQRRIDLFFAKCRIVWGNGAYNHQFGNEQDLAFAKREFGHAILQPTDEQLRLAFDFAHRMIEQGHPDWRYPHPDRILGAARKTHADNSADVTALLAAPPETDEQRAARKARGAEHIARLKAMIGGNADRPPMSDEEFAARKAQAIADAEREIRRRGETSFTGNT